MLSQSEHAVALQRIFSTTDSRETYVEDEPSNSSDRPLIANIGRGTCGSVYDIGATNRVIKLGSNSSELWRDFCQTGKAWETVQQLQHTLSEFFKQKGMRIAVPKVPRCHEFHHDCEAIITQHEEELSGDEGSIDTDISEVERQKPGYIMERILPIPARARIALVKEMFDQEDHDMFLENPENEDCLIRLYFGVEESSGSFNTLRNFPLHDDQMDEIGLDTRTLVTELAMGLAVVHWGVELDGMDIEFVLASSQSRNSSRNSSLGSVAGTVADSTEDAIRRDTQLWVLDFDKATPVSVDQDRDELIRRLVVATSGNDPYFPRPSVNEQLWDQFRWAYVEAGKRILQLLGRRRDLLNLPEAFMHALEAQFEEEDASDEETFLQFEEDTDTEDTFI